MLWHVENEAQISVRQIEDKPGIAAAIFGPLADASINVDMIVQNVSVGPWCTRSTNEGRP